MTSNSINGKVLTIRFTGTLKQPVTSLQMTTSTDSTLHRDCQRLHDDDGDDDDDDDVRKGDETGSGAGA